tara:strand:- start:254 stop:562 length:309 start_codon:yes stop_codon:yes gene_type:complete
MVANGSLREAIQPYIDQVDWSEVFSNAREAVACLRTPKAERTQACINLVKTCPTGEEVLIGSDCPSPPPAAAPTPASGSDSVSKNTLLIGAAVVLGLLVFRK